MANKRKPPAPTAYSLQPTVSGVIFQECPGCSCLVRLLDYAELRLPNRIVHLLHCSYCAVGYVLSVYPEGRSVMLEIRRGGKGYKAFLAAMKEVRGVKSAKALQAALAA